MTDPLPADAHGLIRFADVRALGRQSELYADLQAGRVERLRRGVYREVGSYPLDGDGGQVSDHERRRRAYLAQVHAAALSHVAPVFTSYSAAALLGLPIIGSWPREVYLLSKDAHGSRRPGVITVAQTRNIGIDVIDGCAATWVEFTLLQLARHAPLVDALTATDAALRVPRFGAASPLTTLAHLQAQHARLKPYPGSRRADAVLLRATTRSDSPLESGSRLLIEELGFAEPELQHELWLPELGRRAFLDFYWPEVDVGAEADGRGKYLGGLTHADARGADARGAADAVIREKERENAVRRQISGFDRWDWSEFRRKTPVFTRLTELGIPRVRRSITLI